MNQTLYQLIVKANFKEKNMTYASDCPRKLRGNWVFLQDNDPNHKAHKTMKILERLVRGRLIDHYWSYLDRKVRAAKFTSILALRRKLLQECASMSWTEIGKSVNSTSH